MMRRILIAALFLPLAGWSAAEAALAHWRSPGGAAPSVVAGDAVVRLNRAEAYLDDPRNFARHAPAIRETDRDVLRATPLNAVAMRQLGMIDLLVDQAAGAKKIELAERISRRDAAGQTILINLAAADDDIGETLLHYDRALSVHDEAGPQLFPVLASALDDDLVRADLLHYSDRDWFGIFLDRAIGLADPISLLALVDDLGGKLSRAKTMSLRRELLWRLVQSGRTDEALGLIETLPGGARNTLGDFGFSAISPPPGANLLQWVVHDDEVVDASSVENGLVIRVTPERSGVAAERVTFFAPGEYVLTQSLGYEADAPHARLEWRVSCVDGNSQPFLRESIDVSAEAAKRAIPVSIPAGCKAQHWQLMAFAELSQLDVAARIADLAIAPK